MPGSDHAFSAMAALSLLIIFNIATVIVNFKLFIDFSYQQVKIPVILSVVLILTINYLIFIYKSKYIEIEKRFLNEMRKHKQLRSIAILTYVFLTFIFLFWILFDR